MNKGRVEENLLTPEVRHNMGELYLTHFNVGLELMWTGIGAGTFAYVVHRVREATR